MGVHASMTSLPGTKPPLEPPGVDTGGHSVKPLASAGASTGGGGGVAAGLVLYKLRARLRSSVARKASEADTMGCYSSFLFLPIEEKLFFVV